MLLQESHKTGISSQTRSVRTCRECSKKKLALGALIVHLNDAHHWTRERIAAWVADPDVPQRRITRPSLTGHFR
jgi:hypothetical protein